MRRPWIDPAESAMASVIAVGSVHASSKARNETGTLAMPLLICNISASSSVFGGATSADCNMAIASATESVAEVGTAAIGTLVKSIKSSSCSSQYEAVCSLSEAVWSSKWPFQFVTSHVDGEFS